MSGRADGRFSTLCCRMRGWSLLDEREVAVEFFEVIYTAPAAARASIDAAGERLGVGREDLEVIQLLLAELVAVATADNRRAVQIKTEFGATSVCIDIEHTHGAPLSPEEQHRHSSVAAKLGCEWGLRERDDAVVTWFRCQLRDPLASPSPGDGETHPETS